MDAYREQITAEEVSTTELEVVLPPRDLGMRPNRVLTFEVAAGTGQCGLLDATVETGPDEDGPWEAEDLTGTGIPSLGGGDHYPYRFTRHDRFVRVRARAVTEGGKHCDLTIYVDAEP